MKHNDIIRQIAETLYQIDKDYQNKKYLLAVSGGSDSVAMAYILNKLNLTIEIAHCNFKLRSEESDDDQHFVKKLSEKLNIPFHTVNFNTQEEAKIRKKGIQEVARELRYNWFEKVRTKHSLDYIVTAHHSNDTIETFFINAIRGSGITGLKGIPLKNKKIIRPLLHISKTEIENFLNTNAITYRNDSSNNSLKYSRNVLRHKIIPELDNVHPNAKQGLLNTINNLQETAEYLAQKLKEDLQQLLVLHNDNTISISTHDTLSPFLLFNALKPMGFTKSQVYNILNTKQKGKTFETSSHRLIIDSNSLLISTKNLTSFSSYTISGEGKYTQPFPFELLRIKNNNIHFHDENTAYLDADKITFPLTLRPWKKGDSFVPLGMKGKKKISDFLTDIKANLIEKENTWVLETNGKICWIVNKRIDNRFRLTDTTKNVIKIVTQQQKAT